VRGFLELRIISPHARDRAHNRGLYKGDSQEVISLAITTLQRCHERKKDGKPHHY
jgi:hypothetical protein